MVDADVPCIDPVVSSNDSVERSLVLYNPANTQFVKSPSSPEFSIIVNSDLIPGLKDRILWWGTSRSVKSGEDEINSDNTENLKDCLAIVPWVDIQSPGASRYEESTGLVELTEAEEVEMMDMDDRNVSSNEKEFSEMVEGRELQLWQQQHQHCMKPNLPANPSTPVTW
ncbi:DBH-like monooxygenase [Quillaja saponaria]|nr:DBH-like monooxygenase [Quillaja saponaria]